ncbi:MULTISPECIES: omptin family outer membrane protease [Alphaproteobacteria]|uniref:Outer membrane protease n=2 Tax=Alphaproteobacteria TaxID=28211 RepID=A0A512HGL0_9HYPH|nr:MULTISPECIES: omptin family outer membrane protease [Alphaproteobacteria]GEO84576.1 outer membrane protease [Ciceribacter naphthalenivorans]GLR22539.1 outer membrane protease [Ciceribacter naphthalenivorans]GLT05395.1 outer membrane protease [Sphingomonas psychrolutea]
MTRLLTTTALLGAMALGLPNFAFAADDIFTSPDGAFSVYGGVGLAYIKAEEFVYDGSHKLSQLDWESKGMTLYTLGADAQIDKNWKVRAAFNVGTGGNGHMVDYDWMDYGISDWTDRSIHPDTELDHYFSGSIEVDRGIYENETTSFDVGAGFRYTDVKWTAYGGSYIYSGGGFRDTVGSFPDGERGISYQQKIPVGFLAVNGSHTIGALTLSGGLQGGLSFGIDDIDDHWMRDLRFYDSMKIAPMLGANITANYQISQMASLFVTGSFEKVFHERGDMKIVDTTGASADSHSSDSAGATYQAMSISFGLKGTF